MANFNTHFIVGAGVSTVVSGTLSCYGKYKLNGSLIIGHLDIWETTLERDLTGLGLLGISKFGFKKAYWRFGF